MRLYNYLNENFKSMEEVQDWIRKKSKEYGSKNKFLSSKEYRDVYPEIKKLYSKKSRSKQVEIVENEDNTFSLKYKGTKSTYVASVPPKDKFGIQSALGGTKAKFNTKEEINKFAKQHNLKIS